MIAAAGTHPNSNHQQTATNFKSNNIETTPKRAFKGTTTEMLLAISTIMLSAIAYQEILVPKHKNWKAPFFANLQADINAVLKKYVGVDSAATLRQATKALIALQQTAFSNLSDIRASINGDFSKTKPAAKSCSKTSATIPSTMPPVWM